MQPFHRSRCAVVATLFGLLGCGPSQGDQRPGLRDMADPQGQPPSSLVLTPSTASLTVENGTSTGADFVATAHYADGHEADLTSSASWAIADGTLGLVSAGHYDPSHATHGASSHLQLELLDCGSKGRTARQHWWMVAPPAASSVSP